MILHLLLTGAVDSNFAVHAPDKQRLLGENMARLRDDTLLGYDKSVPPTSTRVGNVSAAGTDVYVQLRFYKLQEVRVDAGELTAKVWLRMKWKDERLAWNESKYGGITSAEYGAESYTDMENSEIWLPDVTPYNAKEGLMDSFNPAVARVSSTGDVTWSRPGNLQVLCRFSGLMMFPLEKSLSCITEIGGWLRSGYTQGVLPYTTFDDELGEEVPNCATGVSSDGSAYEESSAYSYTEYSLRRLDCETEVYYYPCCPNEPWPVLKIRMHISRSFPFYVLGFLMPLVIFTFASFTVFFMGDKSGERLGLGVTLMLVVEVTKYTVQAWLPKCGELLWMDLFLFTSTMFTAASLLWSVLVLAAHYSESPEVIPKEVKALVTGWRPFFKYVREITSEKKHKADDSNETVALTKLKALEGFNLVTCDPSLILAPAMGLKWVPFDSSLVTKEWKPLENPKLAKALLEVEEGRTLSLTLAQYEQFGLRGAVRDQSYIQVNDRAAGKVVTFRPAPSSNQLAKADNALTVCAVEGPPELLKDLGAEMHQIIIKLSPISTALPRWAPPKHGRSQGLAEAGWTWEQAAPHINAVKEAALESEEVREAALEEVPASIRTVVAALAGNEAGKVASFAFAYPANFAVPGGKRSAEGLAKATGSKSSAMSQLLLNGGFIYFDHDGSVCECKAIVLPSDTHGEQLDITFQPGGPEGKTKPEELSSWSQLKLSQAGRFAPITIKGIRKMGAKSFAWVAPNEMRINHAQFGHQACEEGAFLYCTGLNGTGYGAFMRLSSTKERHDEFLVSIDAGEKSIINAPSVHGPALKKTPSMLSRTSTLKDVYQSTKDVYQEIQKAVTTLDWSNESSNEGKDSSSMNSRSLFYELFFYQADSNGSDFIPFEDTRQLLAFLKPSMPRGDREKLLEHCETGGRVDGKLDRSEFIALCHEAFADLSMEKLNDGLMNHSTSLRVLAERHTVKMRRIGAKLDRFAAFAFPILYIFTLLVLSTITLSDNYSSEGLGSEADLRMKSWIPQPATVSSVGAVTLSLAVTFLVALAISVVVTNIGRLQLEKEDRLKGKQIAPVGARVKHETRGLGKVVEVMSDGRTRVRFDSGDEHQYKPTSMHKLSEDAASAESSYREHDSVVHPS